MLLLTFIIIVNLPYAVYILYLTEKGYTLKSVIKRTTWIYAALYILFFSVHVYFLIKEDIPLSLTTRHHLYTYILSGLLLITAFMYMLKGRRKFADRSKWLIMEHQPGSWLVIFIALSFLLTMTFVNPIFSKAAYVKEIGEIESKFELLPAEAQANGIVVLEQRNKRCKDSMACDDYHYEALYYIKNYTDRTLEINLHMKFSDFDQNILADEVGLMTLQPGEIKPVVLHDENQPIWDQATVYTKEKVVFFSYDFKTREKEESEDA